MTDDGEHYFTALGEGRYAPTELTQGAWQEEEQHVAPVIGLLVHALELAHPRDDVRWSRLSVDILGMIRREEMLVTTQVLRPGRTIELLEATVAIGGRPTVRLTGWRLAAGDTSEVAGVEDEAMPAPDQVPAWQGMQQRWGGGFIRTLQFRAEAWRPGRNRVWVRTDLPLVGGEPRSETAEWVGLLDTANGIAVRTDPRAWMFPNVDLTLHLHRQPRGRWVGLNTRVSFGPDGAGVTSSVVCDEDGPVGRLQQSLTVRRL